MGRHHVRQGFRPLTLALGLAATVAMGAKAEPVTITLLHTNDVDDINPGNDGGGVAPLMTLLRQERERADYAITTFGGDTISPSLMSGLTKGSQMIDLHNKLGTDIAVLGNHEFDFGPEITAERVAESDFPWLGTNVIGADGQVAVGAFKHHIEDVAGYKIGFLGLLAPETAELSSPGDSITIAPTVPAAKAAVAELKEQGADIVVALTHDNLADDRRLVEEVDGIHLLLGGHDHDPVSLYRGGTLLAKSADNAEYLLVVDLRLDRIKEDDDEVITVLPTWRFVTTVGVEPDADIQAIVDVYNQELDKDLNVSVGTTKAELDSRRSTVRTQESSIGNLIADATRETLGADIAIANGGGIRGDRTYDAGTVLTRKDVLTELPFGNTAVLIELVGADLLAALENGVSQVEDNAGRFPQVSGLRFTYDASKPAGSRVVEVIVGEAPLDLSETYKVGLNDYIYAGGDGYDALSKGKAIIDPTSAVLLASVVMNYIEQKGEITPEVEGRITRLN